MDDSVSTVGCGIFVKQECQVSRLRLKIGPVVQNAESLKQRVERELPHHSGLLSVAAGVATAARDAEHVSQRLKRPWGLHRLPVAFLVLALLILFGWIYLQFFRTITLKIALEKHDFQWLRSRISRLDIQRIFVSNLREAVDLVEQGKADLGFVQGGIEIPSHMRRLETPHPEVAFWFVRPSSSPIRKILTSTKASGSHSVAQTFVESWKLEGHVEFVHDWEALTKVGPYKVPNDIDAVFVVKDPSDEETLTATQHLAEAGFLLESLELGAIAERFEYLSPFVIPAGYLHRTPSLPSEPVNSYHVATYLIANEHMTPRMLAAASHLLDSQTDSISSKRYELNLDNSSELFQGIEAFLGILINLILAFLALMGLEMMGYRKRFHELNSLVSLISIHQSSKDVLGVADERIRKDHLLYLSLCSDLLGLVSMIGGYYTQENSSLLFSGLPEIIHQRCDGLKINIQLKILHATIKTGPIE